MPHPDATIMVVNDEFLLLVIFTIQLKPLGFLIHGCDDSLQALNQLQQGEITPDLFIIDLALPRMSGLDLARAIREEGLRQPIILSSFSDIDIPEDALLELGEPFPEVLRLPVAPATLRNIVRCAVSKSFSVVPTLMSPLYASRSL